MTDAWNGGKLSSDDSKANVVLFVCGSLNGCNTAVDDLSVAAPLNSTLVLGPGDFHAGRGELQAQLTRFLKAEPRGIILVPNVDKIPLGVLSVLNAVMGEYGALQRDGKEISATGATFLLTWQAPPGILAEATETDFSLAVKKDLILLMRGHAVDEAAMAVVDSFRRRVDLVAPVEEEFLEELDATEE